MNLATPKSSAPVGLTPMQLSERYAHLLHYVQHCISCDISFNSALRDAENFIRIVYDTPARKAGGQ